MVDDRVAVVTGAAGGIGRALLERILRAGWRVVALDRDEAGLASLAATNPTSLRCFAVDVGEADQVAGVAATVDAALGRVDALVTCAGIFARTPALRFNPALFERILRVNLHGVSNVTASFGALMARARGGRIVHVASAAAQDGAALAGAYAASKAGVVALTKSHARELADAGIAVNAVLPGFIDTSMTAPSRAMLERFVLPRVPVKRLGQADEIAEVVEFLMTCRSGYLTGAAILVDGGLHAG